MAGFKRQPHEGYPTSEWPSDQLNINLCAAIGSL